MGEFNSGKEKAPMFGFSLIHGQWSLAWPYGPARGQWKPGPSGAHPYGNLCRNLGGTLKEDISMLIQNNPS